MDQCDSLSNCSESSDEIKSLSSLSSSCMSEFNTEYNELRHLINPKLYPKPTANQSSSTPKNKITDNEKELQNLRRELSNASKLNEQYKLELFNLKSNIELTYSEKITKLLQRNSHLEEGVSNANEQIKRLLEHLKSGGNTKIANLEQQQHLLILENGKLKEQSKELRKINDELLLENEQLKINVNEYQIDAEAKINVVNQLKEKITKQHIENEQILKNNALLKHSIEEAKREHLNCRKSEQFYKDQLKITKKERSELKKTINTLKIVIDEKDNLICDLKSEIAKWNHKYDLLLLKNVEERENLRKITVNNENLKVNQDKLPNEASVYESQRIANQVESISHYENAIEDLVFQLKSIKQNVEDLQVKYEKVQKDNVDLKNENLGLMNMKFELNQLKEIHIDLNNKYALCAEESKQKTDEIQKLQQQLIELEINFASKIKENDLISSSIVNLREKFDKFKLSYVKLKEDLHKTNKENKSMEKDLKSLNLIQEKLSKNEELSKDLQILLNKKDEEIVKLLEIQEINRNKSTLEINKLLSNLDEKDKIIGSLRQEIHLLVVDKNKSIDELNEIIKQNNKAIHNYVQQVKRLQDKIIQKEKTQNFKTKRKINFDKTSQNIVEGILTSIKNDHVDIITLSVIENAIKSIEKFAKALENSELCCESDLHTFNQIHVQFLKLLETFSKVFAKIDEFKNENKLNEENQFVEEIKRLRTLLRVEQLDKMEKRKRYEANYRTLLRTVKEHMKGHNSAKKENAYLQTLYNNLANENNELKLKLSMYQAEIDNLHKSLCNYKESNDKLSIRTRGLQRKLSSIEQCENANSENINSLQRCIKELKEKETFLERHLSNIDQLNAELETKVSKLNLKNANLSEENLKLSKEKYNSDLEVKQLSKDIESLSQKLKLESDRRISLENDKNELQSAIKRIKEQNELFSNEIDILKMDKLEFSNQLKEFEKNKQNLAVKSIENEKNLSEMINNLKNHIERQNITNNSLANDKYFLQRLCNDLKMSLKAHINHNKLLKEQIDLVRQKSDCDSNSSSNSLNDMNIPVTNYDEDYINQLLDANKATIQDKPLLEIQGGLQNLKLEIMTLQSQIAKNCIKN